MSTPFATLKALLRAKGYTYTDLSKENHVTTLSISAVNSKMRGLTDWTRAEMYRILNFLELPEDCLPVIFPDDIYEDAAPIFVKGEKTHLITR